MPLNLPHNRSLAHRRSGLIPWTLPANVGDMRDLSDPRWLYLKGGLFLLLGLLASALLLLHAPHLRIALLLGLAVWSFCRAYYFAFYVVEHYVDPGYRFAGLIDFGRYLLRRRGR